MLRGGGGGVRTVTLSSVECMYLASMARNVSAWYLKEGSCAIIVLVKLCNRFVYTAFNFKDDILCTPAEKPFLPRALHM